MKNEELKNSIIKCMEVLKLLPEEFDLCIGYEMDKSLLSDGIVEVIVMSREEYEEDKEGTMKVISDWLRPNEEHILSIQIAGEWNKGFGEIVTVEDVEE